MNKFRADVRLSKAREINFFHLYERYREQEGDIFKRAINNFQTGTFYVTEWSKEPGEEAFKNIPFLRRLFLFSFYLEFNPTFYPFHRIIINRSLHTLVLVTAKI